MATKKQIELLTLTAADGMLEVGGECGRKVSRRVLNGCIDAGLLRRSTRWHWTHDVATPEQYELTDAGKSALPANGGDER